MNELTLYDIDTYLVWKGDDNLNLPLKRKKTA